jgi:hypothetical protein
LLALVLQARKDILLLLHPQEPPGLELCIVRATS